jgi:hypothetical protein
MKQIQVTKEVQQIYREQYPSHQPPDMRVTACYINEEGRVAVDVRFKGERSWDEATLATFLLDFKRDKPFVEGIIKQLREKFPGEFDTIKRKR